MRTFVPGFYFVITALIGVLNLALVHPVPGLFFLLLSLAFVPATTRVLRKHLGGQWTVIIQTILFVFGLWFTLGISDLGEILGM